MTRFPKPATPSNTFTATYDAWNRMVSISGGGSPVAMKKKGLHWLAQPGSRKRNL